MRIVHVCLTAQYTDGLSYQENLLTKYHKLLGHEVIIITNDCRLENGEKLVCSGTEEKYTNEKGFSTTQKPWIYVGRFSVSFSPLLRLVA
uniref:Glycosyltransferase family 1 protein n=1 Tax=Fervidobacterium pennivorans TaxID=93466 RepID=A0A7V4NFN5_FERPE